MVERPSKPYVIGAGTKEDPYLVAGGMQWIRDAIMESAHIPEVIEKLKDEAVYLNFGGVFKVSLAEQKTKKAGDVKQQRVIRTDFVPKEEDIPVHYLEDVLYRANLIQNQFAEVLDAEVYDNEDIAHYNMFHGE